MILKIMLDRKGEYVLYDGITSLQRQAGKALRRSALPTETPHGASEVPGWAVIVETDKSGTEIEYDGLWLVIQNDDSSRPPQPVSILYANRGNETFTFVVSEAYILNDAGETIQVIRN